LLCGAVMLGACSSTPAATDNRSTPGGSTEVSAAPTAASNVIVIPTYQYVEPTTAASVATAAAATEEVATDEAVSNEAVDRGRGRYVALDCGSCHGENGEGTEQGGPLLEFAMTEDDFISFMRSGGSLGATHQYATNRLSASGGANLYHYLVSLTS
jgi:mono/diheme cytochrome c family protein